MKRQHTSSHMHWLYLTVLGSLALFGVFVWWSLHNQRKIAWENARNASQNSVSGMAEIVGRSFHEQLSSIPARQSPAAITPSAEKDTILAGNDLEALRSLATDQSAGYGSGGLPRQALAALRIHELFPAERLDAFAFLSGEIPLSPLTKTFFETVPTDSFTLKAWKESEAIRQLAEEWLTDPDPRAELWVDSDTPVFLRRVGDSLEYYILVTKDWAGYEDIPPWQHVNVSVGGPMKGELVLANAAIFIPRFDPDPEVAEKPFEDRFKPFPSDRLWLNILAVPEELEAPVRRQQHWALGLFGLAIITCGIALATIHRTLRRQRQLNEMKSQFVASASHELRSPVASIRLMADALESQNVAPEKVREFHRLIAREGARLSTLVGNVLDLSRIEQGSKGWNMELSDLAALTADTIRLMEPLAHEKKIVMKAELSQVDATVDAAAIQQALINLLDNAIKFSPAGTIIITKLASSDGDQNWQLSVNDKGSGIPQAERSRIFERFYRPTDELRRETQGTGIGLSLVKAVAEAHGGDITLESSPGNGSTFTLTVPTTPIST